MTKPRTHEEIAEEVIRLLDGRPNRTNLAPILAALREAADAAVKERDRRPNRRRHIEVMMARVRREEWEALRKWVDTVVLDTENRLFKADVLAWIDSRAEEPKA